MRTVTKSGKRSVSIAFIKYVQCLKLVHKLFFRTVLTSYVIMTAFNFIWNCARKLVVM